KEAGATADSDKPYAGVTIRVIAEQQNPTLAMQKQIPKFEKMTGIKVELEMGPMDSVVSKEILALESGSGAYDIISVPYQFSGQFVENDYLQSIDPFFDRKDLNLEGFDRSDLISGMVSASGEWKGMNYGIPSNTCIMVMFYREDLFNNSNEKAAFKAKYGYDLAPAVDWVQYRDMAEFFTRNSGETLAGETLNNDFYGVSIAGKRHDAMTCEWLNYAWSFGGGIFDDSGNLIMDDSRNVDALQYFSDLAEYSPPGVSQNTWDELTTQMQQGIVAMQIQWNDCAPSIEDPVNSKVAGKVGYAAIPQGEAPAAHYGAWTYFMPADAPNPEAAWLFLQWVNTTEVQKEIALDGGFPTLTSVFKDPELSSSLPYWKGSLAAYEISSKRPRIPEWNEMNNEMMLELSKVIASTQTSEEALKMLQSKYEKILKGKLPVTYQ
ncbi:MAG: extracellular solute-binding protein, partial [Spirochaetales bacterium]|nr:extracellular solute-binding protein [Spirochaetales bacterium]